MTSSIVIFENKTLTLMEESTSLTGGRADIEPPKRAFTQIDIVRDEDNGEILFSLSDNITDVDGHWSAIVLSEEQFNEFRSRLNEI